MTLDLTKPIQTRDGRQAKFLHTVNNPDSDYPVFAVVTNSDGTEHVHGYTTAGAFFNGLPDDCDLVNLPVYQYKLVYKDGDVFPRELYTWFSSRENPTHHGGGTLMLSGRLGWLKCEKGDPDTTVFEPI